MTKGRLPLLFIINIVAVIAQMGAASSLFTVVAEYGNPNANKITRIVYQLLETLSIKNPENQIAVLLVFATIAFFICSLSLMASLLFTAYLQSKIFVEIQPESVRKLISSDFEHLQMQNTGKITNVLVQQIRVVAQSFKLYADILLNGLFALFYLAGALYLKPRVCVLMLVLGIPLFALLRIVNRKSQDISIMNVHEVSRMNALIIQMVSNLKYLKSTATYPKVAVKLRESAVKLANYVMRIAFWSGIGNYGTTPFAIAFISIIIYWQIAWMKEPVGAALMTLGLLYAASQKIIAIPSSYQKFLVSAGAIVVFDEFIKEIDENLEKIPENSKGRDPDFSGGIFFENLSFKYKSGKDHVLRNLNIKIPANSSVAFVGGSGAGKSTIVNLITGLLRPSSGKISISGVDYCEINLEALRQKIGYVTQEPVIFNDTVANNISLWDAAKNRERIVECAVLAHADAFIKAMPNGYDTLLGESGINISGGQRQRISIARELYKNSSILILDEATSALDSETEMSIYESIEKLRGKKTLIIIAHRLSTIRNCDTIFVLDKGILVESGSYDELYAKGGKFKEMVDRQSLLPENTET